MIDLCRALNTEREVMPATLPDKVILHAQHRIKRTTPQRVEAIDATCQPEAKLQVALLDHARGWRAQTLRVIGEPGVEIADPECVHQVRLEVPVEARHNLVISFDIAVGLVGIERPWKGWAPRVDVVGIGFIGRSRETEFLRQVVVKTHSWILVDSDSLDKKIKIFMVSIQRAQGRPRQAISGRYVC